MDQRRPVPRSNRPYLAHLIFISAGRPHLRYLADFMEITTAPPKWELLKTAGLQHVLERRSRTSVAMLDFMPGRETTRTDFKPGRDLFGTLSDPGNNHDDIYARLFVVEGLSRDVIEGFGARFDIDPLFFRGHISDYLWFDNKLAPSVVRA